MLTKSEKKALLACLLFAGASEDTAAYFDAHPPSSLTVEAGQTIFSPDSFSPALALILSGGAVVKKQHGDRETVLNRLSAGSVFGAASLFAAEPFERYATWVVAKRRTTLLLIPTETVEHLVRSDPAVAVNYIRFLSDRIRFLNDRIGSFTADSTLHRVAGQLSALAKTAPDGVIAVNKRELAARLSIARVSLYRAIATLTEQGIIAEEKDGIRIQDPAALLQYL